jgi:signal transduction histidine kinase
MGKIVIAIDCLEQLEPSSLNEFLFETTIIDTGIGIAAERHEYLFRPFLELKSKQNLS